MNINEIKENNQVQIVVGLNDLTRLIDLSVRAAMAEFVSQHPTETVDAPLDIREAAVFIKKEVPTIYTMVREERIPFHKNGKKLYFFKQELIDWIKSSEA